MAKIDILFNELDGMISDIDEVETDDDEKLARLTLARIRVRLTLILRLAAEINIRKTKASSTSPHYRRLLEVLLGE